jgi:hypothetical protein
LKPEGIGTERRELIAIVEELLTASSAKVRKEGGGASGYFTSISYSSLARVEREFEVSFSASLFDAPSTKTRNGCNSRIATRVSDHEDSDPAVSVQIQWLAAVTNWKASSIVLIPAFEPSELVSIFEN